MNGQEFATAVQYGLPIVVVLIDNGIYGTIRMHQEREFPGRVIASSLRNPDFAAYARAFGGHGETVEETAEFLPAFERALGSGLPSIIHVKIDPEAITPATTLSEIRAAALARSAESVIGAARRCLIRFMPALIVAAGRGRGAASPRALTGFAFSVVALSFWAGRCRRRPRRRSRFSAR